jgi:hypothetical protein
MDGRTVVSGSFTLLRRTKSNQISKLLFLQYLVWRARLLLVSLGECDVELVDWRAASGGSDALLRKIMRGNRK